MIGAIFSLFLFNAHAQTHFYKEHLYHFSYSGKTYSCKVNLPFEKERFAYKGTEENEELVERERYKFMYDLEEQTSFLASEISNEKLNNAEKKCLFTLWLDDSLRSKKTKNQIFANHLGTMSSFFVSPFYDQKIHDALLKEIIKKEFITKEVFDNAKEMTNDKFVRFVYNEIIKNHLFNNLSKTEFEIFNMRIFENNSSRPFEKLYLRDANFSNVYEKILSRKKNGYLDSSEGDWYALLFKNIEKEENKQFLLHLIDDNEFSHNKLMILIAQRDLADVFKNKVFANEKCNKLKNIFDRINEVQLSSLEQEALSSLSKLHEDCVDKLLKKEKFYELNDPNYFNYNCREKFEKVKCTAYFQTSWSNKAGQCEQDEDCKTKANFFYNKNFSPDEMDFYLNKILGSHEQMLKDLERSNIYFVELGGNPVCVNRVCRPKYSYCDPEAFYQEFSKQIQDSHAGQCQKDEDCKIQPMSFSYDSMMYFAGRQGLAPLPSPAGACPMSKEFSQKLKNFTENYKSLKVSCLSNKCQLVPAK